MCTYIYIYNKNYVPFNEILKKGQENHSNIYRPLCIKSWGYNLINISYKNALEICYMRYSANFKEETF